MNIRRRFHVEPASWSMDRDALRRIRDVVFVQEQHVPVEEEWDALDPDCQHVLARDAHDAPIGTGRLTPEHKIGRMAVLADWRGHGVGAAILQALVNRAGQLGWAKVSLHAQVQAIGFYRRYGFSIDGEPFMEAGIEHRLMSRTLELPEPPPAERGVTPTRPQREPLQTKTREEAVAALLRIIEDTRHTLVIHHRDLAPGVLDCDDVLTALRRVATSGRGAHIRLLLADPEQALRNGHRLIALAQRLTSTIELRVPQEDEDRAYPSAFIASDSGGCLLFPLATRFDAHGSTCAPGRARQLTRYFNEVWERSALATSLRSLEL